MTLFRRRYWRRWPVGSNWWCSTATSSTASSPRTVRCCGICPCPISAACASSPPRSGVTPSSPVPIASVPTGSTYVQKPNVFGLQSLGQQGHQRVALAQRTALRQIMEHGLARRPHPGPRQRRCALSRSRHPPPSVLNCSMGSKSPTKRPGATWRSVAPTFLCASYRRFPPSAGRPSLDLHLLLFRRPVPLGTQKRVLTPPRHSADQTRSA